MFLILIAAAGAALAWHCRLAGHRDANRRGVVRMGRGHAAGDRDLPELHGLPGRTWRRAGADRDCGRCCARTRKRASDATWLLRPWLLHGAALALLPWLHSTIRGAGRRPSGALVLLRLGSTKNPAGEGGGVSRDSGDQRGAVGRLLRGGLRQGRIRPRRMVRAATSDRSRSCPGASAACCSISASALVTYAPVVAVAFVGLAVMFCRGVGLRRLALEAAVRDHAVPADRHALRDVVGAAGVRRRGSSRRCCRCSSFRPRSPGRWPRSRAARRARADLARWC